MTRYYRQNAEKMSSTKTRICSIFNCHQKYYASHLCRNHYAQVQRGDRAVPPMTIRCFVPSCQRIYRLHNRRRNYRLCAVHANLQNRRRRTGHRISFAALDRKLPTPFQEGERNVNWNGGVGQYPGHHVFRRNRLVMMAACHWRCESCGELAEQAHHRNSDKMDHRVENLQPLCRRCHVAMHRGRRNATSKYLRRFGKTLAQIGAMYGVSPVVVFSWLKRDKSWVPGNPSPTKKAYPIVKQDEEVLGLA